MSDRAGSVQLSGVSKGFAHRHGTTLALSDITLSVPAGQFVAILGPSGCGKTTLLRLIDGLLPPDGGTISLAGLPPQPGPDIGFVFQGFRLIPWANVQDNIAFALTASELSPQERARQVEGVIALVGLQRFALSYPGELSGGMKQRVALARALVSEPQILLMDEPFASLDAHSRELMQAELMQLWQQRQPTVIFVTHSVDEALLLADRVVLMAPRPGRIIEDIAVDLPRPRAGYDVHGHPQFLSLRRHLSERLGELVRDDPQSDFYQRELAIQRQ
jgi:NitT/TauT family transport system ATP-binding protein